MQTTFIDPWFWIGFLGFLAAIFFAFFIPGDLILKKINLPFSHKLIAGIIIGMVLWAGQGVLFGYLGLRFLSYVYLAVVFLFWIRIGIRNFISNLRFKLFFKDLDWFLLLLIIAGVIIQTSSMWFNGIYTRMGLFFCCGNLYDSILHLAITNAIIKDIPPYEPGMSGVIIQNYHYWGNLVLADIIRVFKLPLIYVQYQYSTIFVSLFLGLSALLVGQTLKMSRNFIRWYIFFLYFGGDLIYLIVSFMRKELNFQMSSLEDGAKFLVNPPRAFSIIVFFVGFSFLTIWLKRKDKYRGFIVALLFGSLVGFKIYTGLFVLVGLGFLAGYGILKRQVQYVFLFIMTAIVSLIIYLPVNSSAGGLYFTGFGLFENFIVQPWMTLGYLEQARVIFLEHNNWPRVIEHEFIYFILFVLTIFGTKTIGLLQTKKTFSKIPLELNIFLISGIIVSAIIGFFFQQKSGNANTFNFLVSIFIIGSIYTALACDYWLEKIKKNLRIILIFLIMVLTIPRVMNEFMTNINKIKNNRGYLINNYELDALKYLRDKTAKDDIVLVDYRKFKLDFETPYIGMLSDRSMYLSGIGDELNAHGIDYSSRKRNTDVVFSSKDAKKVGKVLLENKINYLYLRSCDDLLVTELIYYTRCEFSNKKVGILHFSESLAREYLRQK